MFSDLLSKAKKTPVRREPPVVERRVSEVTERPKKRVQKTAVKKAKKKFDPLLGMNDFLLWVQKLDPQNYPAFKGAIMRLKPHSQGGHQRYSFAEKYILLFIKYLQDNDMEV